MKGVDMFGISHWILNSDSSAIILTILRNLSSKWISKMWALFQLSVWDVVSTVEIMAYQLCWSCTCLAISMKISDHAWFSCCMVHPHFASHQIVIRKLVKVFVKTIGFLSPVNRNTHLFLANYNALHRIENLGHFE